MARQRAVDVRDRDAQAVELRRRHLNYRQIAAQMGWASPNAAYKAVQRGLADTQAEPNAAVREIELARLDDIARSFQRVIAAKHYVVSAATGKVAVHPDTGEPLTDHAPVIQACLALIRVMERRAKYLGLDAPTRKGVEVITADQIEARIAELERELAANDPADTG